MTLFLVSTVVILLVKTSRRRQRSAHLPAHFETLTWCSVPAQEGYPGHDWLASSVFMAMCGRAERSLRLLLRLSSLLTSAFIWPARIHASVSLKTQQQNP